MPEPVSGYPDRMMKPDSRDNRLSKPRVAHDATSRILYANATQRVVARAVPRRTTTVSLPVVAMAMVGAIFGLAGVLRISPLPGDAAFYWHPEVHVAGYVYPPVLAQLLEPLRAIGAWQVYVVAWMALCFASLGYVLGRWAFLAVALVVPATLVGGGQWWSGPIESVLLGNVTMPMTAAIVLGMRRPAAWAVPLLTKITPGVGVLWYAFRGEWRAFALALGVTAGIVGVSFVLDPAGWAAYVALVLDNAGSASNGPPIVGPPLWVRLPAAVLLIFAAARTNRPWLVPVACATAIVGMYGPGTWVSVAIGAVALRPDDGRQYAHDRLGRGRGLYQRWRRHPEVRFQ